MITVTFLYFLLTLCTFICSTVCFIPTGARWMLHRPAAPIRVLNRLSRPIASAMEDDIFDEDVENEDRDYGEEDEGDDEGDVAPPSNDDFYSMFPGYDPSRESNEEGDEKEDEKERANSRLSIFDESRRGLKDGIEQSDTDFTLEDVGPEVLQLRQEVRDMEPEQLFPSYAVMYKLKQEFMTEPHDLATAQHQGYCKKFPRLINSETIEMHNSKGVVILFAGLTPDDKAQLTEEVDRFVEDDPLIEHGIVETWNILDLDPLIGEEGGPPGSLDGYIRDEPKVTKKTKRDDESEEDSEEEDSADSMKIGYDTDEGDDNSDEGGDEEGSDEERSDESEEDSDEIEEVSDDAEQDEADRELAWSEDGYEDHPEKYDEFSDPGPEAETEEGRAKHYAEVEEQTDIEGDDDSGAEEDWPDSLMRED